MPSVNYRDQGAQLLVTYQVSRYIYAWCGRVIITYLPPGAGGRGGREEERWRVQYYCGDFLVYSKRVQDLGN